MKSLLFIALVFLSVQACNDKNPSSGGDKEDRLSLGDTLSIYYQQSVQLSDPDIKVTFVDLKDSRCPQNMECIQIGEAVASLEFQLGDGEPQTVEMTSKGKCYYDGAGCGSIKRVMGYKALVYNIYPHPAGGVKMDKTKNFVKMVIRE